MLVILSGHLKCVTKVIWGGQNYLYSSSEDQSVKVWDKAGKMIKDLKGHAHWVNALCLHTDYALRTGCFDENYKGEEWTSEQMQKKALERYEKLRGKGNERLVSASDDNTLMLWDPVKSNKCVQRLTGHQQPINHVQFSPDGRFIISASFDKSLRLWDGFTGAFMGIFRGHVSPVYQICWSPDSRLFVSGSKVRSAASRDSAKPGAPHSGGLSPSPPAVPGGACSHFACPRLCGALHLTDCTVLITIHRTAR